MRARSSSHHLLATINLHDTRANSWFLEPHDTPAIVASRPIAGMLQLSSFPDANKDGPWLVKVQVYCAFAIGACVGGHIVSYFAAQYIQVRRSLSLRHSAQRRKWVSVFLALFITCFFIVFVLSYADRRSQFDVLMKHGDTESARFPRGETPKILATRNANVLADAEGVAVKQVEIPSRSGCIYPTLAM